eukprot:COSAG05_NODE_5075_length_1271_cov_1.401024_2_plen_102_part_00
MNRSADGKLTHDPDRFPSGMKALANYVQSKGLKFGLYSARCGKTCQGRPASQDHEWDDAFTFASWDVDCEPMAALCLTVMGAVSQLLLLLSLHGCTMLLQT